MPLSRFVVAPLLLFVALAQENRCIAQDLGANAAAVQKLKKAIESDYSYRDRLKIDWNKRFEEFGPRFDAAADKDAFAKTTVEFLSAAKDPHLWVKDGQRTIPTFQANLRPNFNPRLLPKLMPQLKQIGKIAVVGSWPDGVRYVAIGTWDDRDPAAMKEAVAAVKSAAEAKAPLIIDVRANMGGDEKNAWKVAGFFVKEPTPYAKYAMRAGGKDLEVKERVVKPDPSGVHHPGPCVVLMGPSTFSSSESFLLMMRKAGCTLIGAKTPGSSGNPKPHDLGNGIVLWLPSWRNFNLDGSELEGVGVEPDVAVSAGADEFRTTDPVLAKALERLRADAKK